MIQAAEPFQFVAASYLIRIRTERDGSGRPERFDDVDALARAREQDHHERGEYSEDFGATQLT